MSFWVNNLIKYFFFILVAFLIVFLFFPVFSLYFNSDDFFALYCYTKKVESLAGFLNFFLPREDVVYYRPLGIPIYFYLIKLLFGLNYKIFHFFSLFFHLINTFLVFLLIRKVIRNDPAAKLGAFLYGTSAVHFLSLGWVVNFSFWTSILLSLFFIQDQINILYRTK